MRCTRGVDRFGGRLASPGTNAYLGNVKRGRRVGDHRARRRREAAARDAEAKAKEESIRQQCADLEANVRSERVALPDAFPDDELHVRAEAAIMAFEQRSSTELGIASERLRAGATFMDRFFATAQRTADLRAIDADNATQRVVEHLRTAQLSKRQLAVLARVISAQLGHAELAIQDARAACEAAAAEVEEWSRSVTVAVEHERPDLAEAARERIEECRGIVDETDAALHEYLELQARLRHLGRVLLELAEAKRS
jgi:hypothetical protein